MCVCVRERQRGRVGKATGRELEAEGERAHAHLGGAFSLTIGFLCHVDSNDIYLILVSACIFLFWLPHSQLNSR